MNETLINYTHFFKDQINELLLDYRRLLRVPIKQLLVDGHVHYGTVHGISMERGHIVFRFNKRHSPRLKVQRSFVLVKRAARERWGESPYSWNCSFEEFLCKEEFHTASSCSLPLYYLPSKEMNYSFVGCGAVSSRMFRKIANALAEGIQVHVLFYEPEPPTRYLANLIDYIERNPDDSILMSKPIIGYDEWKPELLAYDAKNPDVISKTLLKSLANQQKIVLQGPPGTGKSYSAAQIIADYLERGKSVCVTAMANKALMELILQPPLAKFLAEKKLSKTMLSSDEAIAAKGLKDADSDYVVPKGEALFATYYKFSNQFRNVENGVANRLYDLVVVEEASQAYLTTVAASLKLCKDCLIVGDPMQLSPIVQKENKPEYKRWNAVVQAEGLSTFVLGTDVKSFRITTTFRLTKAAAAMTGIFYGNTLTSVAPDVKGWEALYGGRYFPQNGGTIYQILEGGEDGVLSKAAVSAMNEVLTQILQKRPKSSVAIITPFRDSAKAIQGKFSFEDSDLDLSVETIDRVQGATVDYTILYFPLRNAAFALNERRFNVATSRSRTATLILSDFDLLSMRSITGKVREYLEKVIGVVRKEQPKAEVTEQIMEVVSLGAKEEKTAEPDLAQLQMAMNSLQVELMEWIKGWLPIIYPTNTWRDGVVKKLSALQYHAIKANGIISVDGLDLNELLSVFIGSFREFQSASHVAQELQTLAFHIRDIRHVNAHRRTNEIVNVDVKDIKYHIDTADRFLAGLRKAVKPESIKPKITVTRGGTTAPVK